MQIYYIDTEGWVTEEWLLYEFVKTTNKLKEFALFRKAIVSKEEEVKE